jgi:tyrosine-protein kinase Etk/Wzc
MTPESPSSNSLDRDSSPATAASGGSGALASNEISVLDLLIVLAEKKRSIAAITVAFAIVSLAVSLFLPYRYTATVSILTPQQNASMSTALTSQLGAVGGMAALSLGLKNPNDVFVGMFRSRTVEDAMINRFGLMKQYRKHNLVDARKVFEKKTDVDGDAKDKMIHISVIDRDPARAAEIANAYVDQFKQLSGRIAVTEASQRRLFFEQELEQAKNNLASSEEALKQTEQTTGLIQLDSQAKALVESATLLRAQIAAREVQIQGMQTYAAGENSQLVEAQRELQSMRAQLAKLGGSEENLSSGFIVPKGRVPEASIEYLRKVRDVKYYETIFDLLSKQFEIAKLDEAKQGAVIQVVDPAVAPDKRSFPKRGIIVLGATAVGLLLGIFYAFAWAGLEFLKTQPVTFAKYLHFRQLLAWNSAAATPKTR